MTDRSDEVRAVLFSPLMCLNKSDAIARKMGRKFLFFVLFIHLNVIYGATIIDSGVRQSNTLQKLLEEDANDCSQLISTDLIDEIRSYQPIVNQIVEAATNKPFSGSTWNRLVAFGCK